MSVKAIREYGGKKLMSRWISDYTKGEHSYDYKGVLVTPDILDKGKLTWDTILSENPWLQDAKVVAKPDQLIKRRGKAGLLAINKTFEEAKTWIMDRMCKDIQVETVTGQLTHFLIEPMCPHEQSDEYYVCIHSERNHDEILFTHEGGVDIGDVDAKATRMTVSVGEADPDPESIKGVLLWNVPESRQKKLASFISGLFTLYRELHFAYLEINPLVMLDDNKVVPLDLAAKIDETADFLCAQQWGQIDYPAPFGRSDYPEEAYIRELDGKTGASLKLTILNPKGRVWTMVAGGGASVVYADTVADYGFGAELANYGEYSGAPTTEETYQYAKTLLSLMLKSKHPDGKVLIIGGGIANFTDVAQTFTGLIKALNTYAEDIKEGKISIWVRRAGPNYREGLRMIKKCSDENGLGLKVYGPETHITACIPMALGLKEVLPEINLDASNDAQKTADLNPPEPKPDNIDLDLSRFSWNGDNPNYKSPNEMKDEELDLGKFLQNLFGINLDDEEGEKEAKLKRRKSTFISEHNVVTSTRNATCIIYGLQLRAIQGMLDFDHLCLRSKPSVSAIIFPFDGNGYQKFYWGTGEILIPVYTTIKEASEKCPDTSIFINFASFRSVFETSMDCLKNAPNIKTMAIIAEGVPERQSRLIIKEASKLRVGIVGPATVGGIKPGCVRLGNTGGMLDNVVMSKLYRPGSVAYVSKSGGMSNELNNIICRNSNGVYEGVAIGGDRYAGSRFLDHMTRYADNPEVKMLVLLGEVGGVDEYEVVEAVKSGKITKPLIAWCVGTCASCFSTEVQFGHAGAQARGDMETAKAKNAAMKEAGILVPDSFDGLPKLINYVYHELVKAEKIVPFNEPVPPTVPMDYTWAKKLGVVRKPTNFICSISDDRGEECTYGGMKISDVFAKDIGIGGVLSILWFKRLLPPACTTFLEMVLMITADHGPAVSGAHNAIVTARAGKDLISSLVSGMLTIGPRFGGALDDAALFFMNAVDSGLGPKDFVTKMKKENKLIMGIGHRIKSLANPDQRVEIIKKFAKEKFSNHECLNYALAVEQITTKKKANLILNVDGCIAVCFVDMIRSCGAFSKEQANEIINGGCLNGLFVIGRSMGFIGHFLDQNRLKQPLYRHPWDDITYVDPNN
jgi:ATP citrate (pro-S)-lyase